MISSCIFVLLLSFTIADDPCRFEHPSKGIIDLTSLAATHGEAAYPNQMPTTVFNYSKWILICIVLQSLHTFTS